METITKNQLEMKDTLTEIKNNLQGINSRVDEAKNQINDLEYKEAKNNQSEQQEGKRIQNNEDSVRSLHDNFKLSKMCITGVLERGETEEETGNVFEEIIKENFPNSVKEIDI